MAICCICGKSIVGYGNNPWPITDKGECCDECNFKFVLPARLEKVTRTKDAETFDPIKTAIKTTEEAVAAFKKAMETATIESERKRYAELYQSEKEQLGKLQTLATKIYQ